MEDSAVLSGVGQDEQVAEPELNEERIKSKKRVWKKAPLAQFWDPEPYLPAGKGSGKGNKAGYKGGKGYQGGGTGDLGEKGCHKGGKGREKRSHRGFNGGKGVNVPGGPTRCEDPGSGVDEKLGGKARREGGKGRREGENRGGKGLDGKSGRFSKGGDGLRRSNGETKGQSYGASDRQDTLVAGGQLEASTAIRGPNPWMQLETCNDARVGQGATGGGVQSIPNRMVSSTCAVSAPISAACAPIPFCASVFQAAGGTGASACPSAPMSFASGCSAILGGSAMPPTYGVPYFVVPASAAGYPHVLAVHALGTPPSAPDAVSAVASQNDAAKPLPPDVQGMAFCSPATPVTSGDSDDIDEIMKQVEYYFSAKNLIKDIYLRMHMNEQGWVAVTSIANSPGIRKLTKDPAMVQAAIASSTLVELDAPRQNVRIRKNWGFWPIVAGTHP